jgi:hypothetical protein
MIRTAMAPDGMHARTIRFLDWKPVSALCIVLLAAIVWSHGPTRPTYTNADPDIIYAYESLLINGGLDQNYFDHTGYIYILLLSVWTRVLHVVGLLGPIRVQEFATMPPPAFETAYYHLVVAGRAFSLLIAAGFVVLLWHVVHLLTRSRAIAAVAALLFAISPGLTLPAMITRPEMLSALFAFAAFAALVHAAGAVRWRAPALLALGAFLAMAAMMTKVQAVPLLLALPVLAIAFGQHHPVGAFPWQRPGDAWIAPTLACAAVTFGLPALTMVFGRAIQHGWPLYQIAIAVFVAASVALYARVHRLDPPTAAAGATAVLAGWSAAQYLHLITNVITNTDVVANFFGHMTQFTPVAGKVGDPDAVARGLLKVLWRSAAQPFQIESPNSFPLRCAFWLSFPAVAYLVRARAYRAACQGGLLVGLAYAMEVYCNLRSWSAAYYLFATPWLIAGATLLAAAVFRTMSPHPKRFGARHVIATLVVVALAWTVQQSARVSLRERNWQPPSNLCGQKAGYLHKLPKAFPVSCP